MHDIIKARYPYEPTKTLAAELNITPYSLYHIAYRLGLKKDPEYRKTTYWKKGCQAGVATQFKKGHVPLNKGQKMSKKTYNKVAHTMFKKGNKPPNTKPADAVTIRMDNSNIPYKYLKIRDSNWQLMHRVIYEQYHGPIPKGSIVTFKDANTMNCHIDNLICITMAENMIRNSIQRYPEELKKVIRLNSKLKKQIKNGTKQN